MNAEWGDEIEITVKGKYVRSDYGTKVVVTKPAPPMPASHYDPYGYLPGTGNSEFAFGPLDPKASISVTITSQYKNGVHIDLATGLYWMRKPDGWRRMSVASLSSTTTQSKPEDPQRLKEA